MGQALLNQKMKPESISPCRYIYRWDEQRMIRLAGKSSRLRSTFNPLSKVDHHSVKIICERSEVFRMHDRVLFENWIERGHFQAWSGEITEVLKIKDYHPRLGVRKKQQITISFHGSQKTYTTLYERHLQKSSSLHKIRTLFTRLFSIFI